MLVTWITLVASVSVLIQAGVSCEVNHTVVNVALGEALQLDCCENQTVSWWKDDQRLSNSTGGQFYSREVTQLSDEGDYLCNNTNAGRSFHVRVGEKPPTPPPPVCFDGPNTTIYCNVTRTSNPSETTRITYQEIRRWSRPPSVCEDTSMDSCSIDIDRVCGDTTCELVVTVSNDFGNSTNSTLYHGGLYNKVFPDPPENVTLRPIGQFYNFSGSFNGSFRFPDTWKTGTYTIYQYKYTHLNQTHHSIQRSSQNLRTVYIVFEVQNKSVPGSKVCLQVRFKFGSTKNNIWSDYSKPVCNYTPEGKPKAPPQNFAVEEDRRMETPGLVTFSWEPPPKEQSYASIERYKLTVKESVNGDFTTRESLNITGSETQITLTDELDEDRAYRVDITAWTTGGESPPAIQTLRAHQRISVSVVNVALGEALQLDCCENQTVSWWKDDQRLSNSTGGQFYSREVTQLSDEGDYLCNNTNAARSFHVRVGEKPPTPPPPVCFDGPNTTIYCNVTRNSNPSETTRITYQEEMYRRWGKPPSVCEDTSMDSCSIDIDGVCVTKTCELVVTVSNDFGNSTSSTLYHGGLYNKVFPDPPENVTLRPIGQFYNFSGSFNGSFRFPDTWKTKSYTFYQYKYTHLNQTQHSIQKSSQGPRTVHIVFEVQNKSVPDSKVCLQVRFRFGLTENEIWGDYSKPVCNYTPEGKPKAPPQNFAVEEDRRMETPGLVTFSWEPPPKEKSYASIKRYKLTVKESVNGDFTTMESLNITGTETQITLTDVLDEDRAYTVGITAWTTGGESPPAIQTLRAHQRISVLIWILFPATSSVALLLLLRCSWIIRRKMQADHLPEPYLILPEVKILQMLQTLSRKGPPPPEKEVFDPLKSRDNDEIHANPKMDDNDNCNTSDPETSPVEEQFGLTDSGVLPGSSTYSSSGARSYSLMPTPGKMSPDDSNVNIERNESSLDSLPTSSVPSEVSSDQSGYVKHSELSCNDSGCYTEGKRESDPNYENYSLPFQVRVHETMQMLNGNQGDDL